MATNLATAVILVSIMAAATAAFMANYFSFTQDVSPRHTGLVVGYLGAIGNLFAAGFQPFAGTVKDLTGSYALVFAIIGLAPLIGLAALFLGLGHATVARPPRRNDPMRAGLRPRSGWTPRGAFWQDLPPHRLIAVASTFAARDLSRVISSSTGRPWTRPVLSGKVVEHDPSNPLAHAGPGRAVPRAGGLRAAPLVAASQGRR